MKTISSLLMTVFVLAILSCSTNEQKKEEKEEQPSATTDGNTVNKESREKYLITDSSAGEFKIGSAWQSVAQNTYSYKFVQGYGSCVDACCSGGFDLGTAVTKIESKEMIDSPAITITASAFGTNDSKDAYKTNPNVFYVTTDNCSGWYLKDKIEGITVYPPAFQTKEGIGVNTTLEKIKELTGDVVIKLGWLEEDVNAIYVVLKEYPTIKFVLNIEDAVGGYDQLSKLQGVATIADFKQNTQIKWIVLQSGVQK